MDQRMPSFDQHLSRRRQVTTRVRAHVRLAAGGPVPALHHQGKMGNARWQQSRFSCSVGLCPVQEPEHSSQQGASDAGRVRSSSPGTTRPRVAGPKLPPRRSLCIRRAMHQGNPAAHTTFPRDALFLFQYQNATGWFPILPSQKLDDEVRELRFAPFDILCSRSCNKFKTTWPLPPG